jgi:AcrR family transcriptional regulator
VPARVDHQERRRQIAEALLRIAASRGLQAASMREVAAEAGVSLRLVQYYFHTKDELLIGSLPYLGERLTARVQARLAALGTPPSPRQVIEGVLLAVLPTDEESRSIRTTYDAFYALVLTEPRLAEQYEARDPDALERLLARRPGPRPRRRRPARAHQRLGCQRDRRAAQRRGRLRRPPLPPRPALLRTVMHGPAARPACGGWPAAPSRACEG